MNISRTDQARVQEFVRGGGGPKSESFFLLCFSIFQGGGGPAQKIDEKIIFWTKKSQNIGELAANLLPWTRACRHSVPDFFPHVPDMLV